MSKTKSNTVRDMKFRRVIKGYISTSGLTENKICENLGISVQTFINYMDEPDKIRRGDLRRLCDMIHVSDKDRGEMLF